MLGYKVAPADKAMLVSGRGIKTEDDVPFQIVTGGAVWAPPFLRRVSYLPLGLQEAHVTRTCFSSQGIELIVEAGITFSVGPTQRDIAIAGQLFASQPERMLERAKWIFADQLSTISGLMAMEEIAITTRQKFIDRVRLAADGEMKKLGLSVYNFEIESIDDRGEGYLSAVGEPQRRAIRWAPLIAGQVMDVAAIAQLTASNEGAESNGLDIRALASETVERYRALANGEVGEVTEEVEG